MQPALSCCRSWTRGFCRELQANLTLYLGIIIQGFNMGYSAVAIPDIELEWKESLVSSSSSFIPVIEASQEQLSWFGKVNMFMIILRTLKFSASSVNIGQIFGCLIGGYCGGKFGPKKTMLLFSFPAIISWLGIAFSPYLGFLILGRVVCGFCAAISIANSSLLVAQYSSTRWRGAFLSLYGLMIGIGILIAYSLGAALYWRYVAAFPTCLLLLYILGLSRLPESPIWMLGHKGASDTKEALIWLRGTDDVDNEMKELVLTKESQDKGLNLSQALRNISRPDIHRPFLICLTNFAFVRFAGPFAIVFYAVNIFQESGIDVDVHVAAVIVAAVRVLGGIMAIFFIQKIPRVKLVMIMMSTMSLSMIVLGTVMYLKENGAQSDTLRILPVICIMLYMFAFGAGAAPLQWVFLGELLPPEYKVLSGIITSFSTLAVFIVTQLFPTLLEVILPSGTYWMFGGVALVSNLFYALVVPETKGKSILEIRNIFTGNTPNTPA